MRASRQCVVVVFFLAVGFGGKTTELSAQTVLESPAFSDSRLLAAIFASPPSRPTSSDEVPPVEGLEPVRLRKDFELPYRKARVPDDWDAFEKQFGVVKHEGNTHLQILEDGMYKVNETIFSIKLFERRVNSLLNLEYSFHELTGYDSRSKDNEIDNFFDHAKLKTDFDWDAPVGLYVGLRLQIKCYSIFQFWK